MSTPLKTPITLNITVETQEQLLALLLRVNLDADNLRDWYHNHRSRPGVIVPDMRLTGVYKVLKAHMKQEGFVMERAVSRSSGEDNLTVVPRSNVVAVSLG